MCKFRQIASAAESEIDVAQHDDGSVTASSDNFFDDGGVSASSDDVFGDGSVSASSDDVFDDGSVTAVQALLHPHDCMHNLCNVLQTSSRMTCLYR